MTGPMAPLFIVLEDPTFIAYAVAAVVFLLVALMVWIGWKP